MNTEQLFISHSFSYDNQLQDLRNLLDERNYFKYESHEIEKEEPIESENAYYIKSKITEKLKQSNVFLVIAGMYTNNSDWIKWEINKAKEIGLKIIGVKPRGNKIVPTDITEKADEIVNWDTESIVEAIRKYKK